MKIRDTKKHQKDRLKELCEQHNVNFESMEILLNSVRTKKLLKRNNYHEQKIIDIIENATK